MQVKGRIRARSRAKSREKARGQGEGIPDQVSSLHLPHHPLRFPRSRLANICGAAPQWTLNSVTDWQCSLLGYFLVGPQCHFWSLLQFAILSSAEAEPAYSHPLILAQTSAWVNSFFFLRSLQKKFPLFLPPCKTLIPPWVPSSFFFFLSLGRFR